MNKTNEMKRPIEVTAIVAAGVILLFINFFISLSRMDYLGGMRFVIGFYLVLFVFHYFLWRGLQWAWSTFIIIFSANLILIPFYFNDMSPAEKLILFPNSIFSILSLYWLIFVKDVRNFFKNSRITKEMDEKNYDIFPMVSTRFFSILIDSVLLIAVLSVCKWIIPDSLEKAHSIEKISTIIALVFVFTYIPVFTSKLCTLGHLITGIRIRTMKNKRLTIFKAYIRLVVKILLGWVSFITVFIDKNNRAIHDYAVDSIVIKAKK